MINSIEGALLTLSAAVYAGAKNLEDSKYEQVAKGISQVVLGTALVLRGSRASGKSARIGLVSLGLATVSLGIFNAYLGAQSPQPAPLVDKWQITVSKALSKAEAFQKYPDGEITQLPESEYEMVGWDQFKIHSLDQKKLYTTQLGPCLGLSARGYDQNGQLSHVGIAHKFMNDDLPKEFLKKMGETAKGRIELFIAGGDGESTRLVNKILTFAKKSNIAVLDNLSKIFFRDYFLFYSNMVYRGSSGITQLFFDSKFNPHIQADLLITGLSNLNEVLSDPLSKLKEA